MKNFISLRIVTFTVILLSSVVVYADDAGTLADIDKRLTELKTFHYERNGDSLRDLEATILQLPANSPLRAKVEEKLIVAIESSNEIGKGIICRQLRIVGTDKCIPVITPLLVDPQNTDAARLALQGIGSPAAARAMHEALGKTNGAVQVGLINALAELSYEPLRTDCIGLIQSQNKEVAGSAVRALGTLGGMDSLKVLTQLKSNANGQLTADIDLAIVRAANKLVSAGDGQKAKEFFAALYKQGGPIRLAALRGLVMADPERSSEILVSAMRGQDRQLAIWAINLTPYAKDKDATAQFVALLDEMSAELKVLMLESLAKRADPKAAPAILAATKSKSQPERQAALEALGAFSGAQAIDTLLEAAAEGGKSDQPIARAALARIDAAETRLAATAKGSNDKLAVEAIRSLASRKAAGQSKLILELARDDNPLKRAAAIETLGVLIDAKSLESLIQLALEDDRAGDLKEIERSLGRVLNRIENPDDRARPLLQVLANASARTRPLFIRQLSKAGTDESLATVHRALQSSDADESDAAVVALSVWPNEKAGDDLVKLIESARSPELKNIALNGFLRIASESGHTSEMLLGALKQVSNTDTKKRMLEAIGLNSDSFEAIAAMESLLDQTELKSTAAIATIRIADKLRLNQELKARMVLERVIAKVDDPEVKKQAQEVLNEIDRFQDHIMRWVIIGPFGDKNIENGEQSYKTVYEPEQADTSKLKWKPLEIGIGRWDINLEATFGPVDHCCAYVRTMVWSPIDQEVQIEGGCDDALKMWVNGEVVFDDYGVRGGSPRKMRAPAKLREGWNELKLKAVDHEGGWAFGCRVRKPNGTKLDGLKYEAR